MKDEKKDEKQMQNDMQNEPEQHPASDTDLLQQIAARLGLADSESPEETTDERSDFIVIPDVVLQCKSSLKAGKVYKDYILHGKLRDVPAEIYFRPGKNSSGFTDVNGYKLLDIVFGDKDKALFAVRVTRQKDRVTQRVTTTKSYVAYVKDQKTSLDIYAPLRPDTVSDRAMLEQLLAFSNLLYDLKLPA